MSQGIFITSCGSLVSHCSALQEDTPASQEGRLLLSGQASFPCWAGDTHTVGKPPPLPGLPWDTDHSPPPFSSISQQPPTSQTEAVLSTNEAVDWLFTGKISFQRDYCWEGLLRSAPARSWALEQPPFRANTSGRQRDKGRKERGTNIH